MRVIRMSDLDLTAKRVFIRADLNVPLQDGKVSSDARITASLPTIEYALKEKNISKFDDVVICEKSGKEIQIFIDPKVSMFLIGSEMIFKQDELSSGFDFVNPNEKGRCGCGESFNI